MNEHLVKPIEPSYFYSRLACYLPLEKEAEQRDGQARKMVADFGQKQDVKELYLALRTAIRQNLPLVCRELLAKALTDTAGIDLESWLDKVSAAVERFDFDDAERLLQEIEDI